MMMRVDRRLQRAVRRFAEGAPRRTLSTLESAPALEILDAARVDASHASRTRTIATPPAERPRKPRAPPNDSPETLKLPETCC